MVPVEEWPLKIRKFSNLWEDWKSENGYIDFTGMIERALTEVYSAPGLQSVLIGDECQDWSRLEIALLRDSWGARAEIVILAGDSDQTIFSWRGADPRCFLDNPIPDGNKRVLSQSHRLSAAVHKFSQKIIKRIRDREQVEFYPTELQGSVKRKAFLHKRPQTFLPFLKKEIAQDRSVMLLTSCSYMLRDTITALKTQGIPFWNPYKRDERLWNPLGRAPKKVLLIDRLMAFLSFDGDEGWRPDDIKKWFPILRKGVLTKEVEAAMEDKLFIPPKSYEEIEKMFIDPEDAKKSVSVDQDWLRVNAKSFYRKKLRYFRKIYKKLGKEALQNQPKLTIGTIHSVKGGEADTVIIFPDISKAAISVFSRERKEAVIRQFYVGITRSKDKLVLGQKSGRMAFVW